MLSAKKDFWDDPENAKSILQKKTKISDALDGWRKFKNQIQDAETLLDIALEEKDEKVMMDLSIELGQLERDVENEELKMMLSSEQDPMNAIVSIHAPRSAKGDEEADAEDAEGGAADES